jgi:hypothetical protein
VPNIRSDRPDETRDFFVELLGFEVSMDLGWVVTVASPTNPSAQVTIVGNDDPVRARYLGRGGRRLGRREPLFEAGAGKLRARLGSAAPSA